MKKKFSWLLVLSLILSLVPATALSAEDAECEYCLLDYICEYCACEYCAEEADENGDDADENGDDADENGDDAEENGDDAEENGDDADENGDDAEENGDDAEENGDDAEENGDDADENGDDADENGYAEIVPILEPISAEYSTVLRFVIGETVFTRNGAAQPALDAAPFIDAAVGRTMVPIAAIGEGLGATVTWNRETRNVTIIRGDINLVINIDSDLPDEMGRPAIVEGRTFVPIAYVSEQLGATVDWDRDAQAVYVQE